MTIDIASIQKHMTVTASDGEVIGKVDSFENGKIKLTKHDSPDGRHHLVPLSWIDRVGSDVRLTKTLFDIRSGVKAGEKVSSGTDAVPDVGQQDAVPDV